MRLTLDIDGKNRGWWAWGIYYMLRDSGEFRKVEIWMTRKGYHIIAYGGGFSPLELKHLRMAFGDDPIRVEIDTVKHPLQPVQVLWNIKDGWEAKLLDECEKGENTGDS